MTDVLLLDRINRLAHEEENLWQQAGDTGGIGTAEQARLNAIGLELDQCYDLLRQRQARRELGRTRTMRRFARRRWSSATSSEERWLHEVAS